MAAAAVNMKKKRLSLAPPLRMLQESDNEAAGSPLVKANDDEKERRERRKSAAMISAKRDLILTPKKTPLKAGRKSLLEEEDDEGLDVPAGRALLGSSQLTDLYANCIKMCTENKINQKNSWSLNLIDYISEVLDVRPGEMTNFQVASCTLDASVKIYSCRVDSVLSDTFKVLGGLNRGDAAPVEGEEGQGEGEKGEGEEETKKAKPSRVRTSCVTLEANPASLNVKKFDLEFDIDPLFRKTSAAFDEGGAKGLLLHHLSVQDGGRLLFDSADTADAPAPGSNAPAAMLSDFWAMFSADLKDLTQRKVCPTFDGFTFTGWQPPETTSSGGASKAKDSLPLPSTLDIDLDMDGPSGDCNDDGDGYGEFFSSPAHDGGEAGGEGMQGGVWGDTQGARAVAAGGMVAMATGRPEDIMFALAASADDYSYFNSRKIANWAGPSHWKLRTTTTDPSPTEARKKAPKAKFSLDFSAPAIDRNSAFATSRAATTLSKATLSKGGVSTLLPDDVHYSVTDLTRLFCKPAWTAKVLGRQRKANEAVDADAAPYDYSNPNDVNNYCADNNDGDEGGFEGDGAGDSFSDRTRFDMTCDVTTLGGGATGGELSGGNLLQAPAKVEKIDIHYERVAKRINVKQLKASMWDQLQFPDTPCGKASTADQPETKSFAEVFSALPSRVGQSTSAGLSVPIAFVCLLHLANEKSLALTNCSGMADLVVGGMSN